MPLSNLVLTPSDFLQKAIMSERILTSGPTCHLLANNGITDERASKGRYKYSTKFRTISAFRGVSCTFIPPRKSSLERYRSPYIFQRREKQEEMARSP